MQPLQYLIVALCLTSALNADAAPPSVGRQSIASRESTGLKSTGLHGLRVKLSRTKPTLELPETSYYGAASFGSTRENKFNVVFDTSTSQVWVPTYQSGILVTNELHYYCGYDASLSPEARLIAKDVARFSFQDVVLRGSLYEDTVTLYNDASKDEIISSTTMVGVNNRFYSVDYAENYDLQAKTFDGVVGLAPNVGLAELRLNNTQLALQPEFIRLQQEQDPNFAYTPSSGLVFGLWLNPELGETDFAGELTLGTYDGGKVHFPSLQFHNISRNNGQFAWQLELEQVKLSSRGTDKMSEVVSCKSGCQAVLNSGNDSLVGPSADIQLIRTRLDATYNDNLKLWTVKSCKNLESLPALTFTFANPSKEYSLTAYQYTAKLTVDGEEVCYLTLKDSSTATSWSLGTSFLQAYYTIFDLSSGHIGLAEFKSKL